MIEAAVHRELKIRKPLRAGPDKAVVPLEVERVTVYEITEVK